MSVDQSNIGSGSLVPPLWEHVSIYFQEKGLPETQAILFFNHYQQKAWLNPWGELIGDWKQCAWQWIWNGPGNAAKQA